MTAKPIRYFAALVAISVCEASLASAQVLAPNPTPEMYVATNKGGSRIVPNGQLRFDGISFTCGRFPTVEDPLLNNYAAAPYKGFLIINPTLFGKVPTTVKLWIYQHECAHALGLPDETKADCFSVSKLRRQGLLSPQGLEQVCDFISAGQADAAHPSGPERCTAIGPATAGPYRVLIRKLFRLIPGGDGGRSERYLHVSPTANDFSVRGTIVEAVCANCPTISHLDVEPGCRANESGRIGVAHGVASGQGELNWEIGDV
jgi:hypothetical protein